MSGRGCRRCSPATRRSVPRRRPGKQDWLVDGSANVRIPHTGLSTRDAYRVLLEEWGARQRGSLFSRSNNIAIRLLYFSSPLYEDRADLEPLAARAPPGDTSAPFSAVGAAVCARVEARMERAKRLRIKTRRERV